LGIIATSVLIILASSSAPGAQAEAGEALGPKGSRLLDQQLDPGYRHWVRRPAELLGFWMGDVQDMVARTGATGGCGYISLAHALRVEAGDAAPRLVYHWLRNDRPWVRMHFTAPRPIHAVAVLGSTSAPGARGEVTLLRVDENGVETRVASGGQGDAAHSPWIVATCGDDAAAGDYVLEVRAQEKNVDVWPGPGAADLATRVVDGRDGQVRDGDALIGWALYADGTWQPFRQDDRPREHLSVGAYGLADRYREDGVPRTVCVGEHNNPFFIRYPPAFFDQHPESRMQDKDGNVIALTNNPISGRPEGNPQTAYDDPTITALNRELIRTTVAELKDVAEVDAWVIGGEQLYPDCLGLPPGDFRPESMAHFQRFVALRGWDVPTDAATAADPAPTPTRAAWLHFREQAMADRAAVYYQEFLAADPTRLVYYPTCNNPFVGAMRANMGHAPARVLGVSDGYETGQIAIDDDQERMNLMTVLHYAAYGAPVVTPRLGNKTLNPEARGGGTTFTPPMLRRLVMECLGAGIRQIGLIEWDNDLADGEWHIRGTPAEDEARAVFAELKAAALILEGMARLQPEAALFLSDAEWLLDGWNPQWTGFVQDAMAANWRLDQFGDARLSADLVDRVPLLVSIGNAHVSDKALAGLEAYLEAGGVVVAFGPLATHDELYRPRAAPDALRRFPGLVSVPDDALGPERILRNRYSTAAGAGGPDVPYRPVRFDAIADAAAAHAPEVAATPILLDTGDAAHVEAYPLTDGDSLLVVLVNHEDRPVTVRVRADARISRAMPYTAATDAVTREPFSMEGDSAAKVMLAERGSALVWFHDAVSFVQAAAALDDARAAIARWREADVPAVVEAVLLDAATRALGEGLPAKTHALARSISSALGVAVDVVERDDGGLDIEVRVRDAQGAPVRDAHVTARVLPDRFEQRALTHAGDGRYALSIPVEALGRFYDPARACYDALTVARRVLITARDGDGRSGGLMWTSGTDD